MNYKFEVQLCFDIVIDGDGLTKEEARQNVVENVKEHISNNSDDCYVSDGVEVK